MNGPLQAPPGKRYDISYGVCQAGTVMELMQAVSQMIGQGFMPLGGLCATGKPGIIGVAGQVFYQAVMRTMTVDLEPQEQEMQPKIVAAS